MKKRNAPVNPSTRSPRKLCAVVSVFLSLVLLLQVPMPAMASSAAILNSTSGATESETSGYISADIQDTDAVDINSISDDQIVGELTDRRGEYVKYFRLVDGTVLSATYDKPVHIKDTNGTWQELDYRLADNESEYENSSGSMRVKFSKKPKNGKLYTLKTDDGQIKWSLSGAKESAKEAKLSQKAEKTHKLEVLNTSGCVSYEDILPGVTLQYWVSEKELKENIIFADRESAGPLQFLLQTNKFELTLQDNTVYFANDAGENVLALSAPWMMDSEGNVSDAIVLGLSGSGNHYTVTVTPDQEWLENAVFPVTVDPIIQKNYIDEQFGANDDPSVDRTLTNTYVRSNYPNSSAAYAYGSIAVGREESDYGNVRGAIKFALPTSVSSANRVIAASLQMTHYDFRRQQSDLSVTVNVHKITANLPMKSLTWNTLNGNYDTKVLDSQVLTLATANAKTRVPFDITTVVRDWYQNGNNYGLAFVSDNENGAYNYVRFYTSKNAQVSNGYYPALIIQFADNSGIEDNLTYHTAGNSEMGMVYVNDFNGNLVYMFEDAATNGNLFPTSVSHVFDNSRRNIECYYNGNAYVGSGFRLNNYERIISDDSLPEAERIPGYPYRYLDADGTWHFFKVKNEASYLYVDEFYPTRVLQRLNNSDGSVSGFKLTDTSNIESYFTSNGHLSYKKDVTNNKTANVNFFGTNAIVAQITDGAGKAIAMSYASTNGKNYLQTITDPAGRATTYGYTGTRLTSVTRPGNRTVTLNYDSYGSITKITSYDGSSIEISYYSNAYNNTESLRRVNSITKKGTDGTEGRKLTFTYGTGETTVTDRDGKTETMMFDDFGQTVCVRDNEGRASFLKYNSPDVLNDVNPGLTDNSATAIAKATSLQYSTSLQSTVNNYVSNGDFEDSTLGSWTFENSTDSGTGSAALSTAEAYAGSGSLKLQSTSSAGRYGYRQTLTLPDMTAGTVYTLSAYVKITDLTATTADPGGAAVYFGYQTSDGTWHTSVGEPLQTKNEWVRISHTWTVPENTVNILAEIGLFGCTGTAYFDNVQVESGSVLNNYNYIDNGHFRDASGTLTPSAFQTSNLSSATDGVVVEDGRTCYKIAGERTKDKNINQVVYISGSAGDKFTFGAWAKATGALSLNGGMANELRRFQVRISFVDVQGNRDDHYFSFESKTDGWQFLAGEAVSDIYYMSVHMSVIYNRQKNAVFVDDLCLFKEGCTTRYTYDDWGRVTSVQDINQSGDSKTTYTYWTAYSADPTVTPDDKIYHIDYYDGTVEYYYYDSNRLAQHIDADGIPTVYYYDSNGNLTKQMKDDSVIDHLTYLPTSTTGYTANGNYANSVTDPWGNTVTSAVDETKGLVTSITDAKNTVTSYTYDSNTDAVKSVQSGSSSVNYGYTNHKLTSILHSISGTENVAYNFTYDVFGNTDKISVGSRTLIDHTYAANNGNLTRSDYGNGFYTENLYDSLNRVIAVKQNGIKKYTWDYDYKGNVGVHTDLVNSIEYRYTYDSLGRVTQVKGTPTAAGFKDLLFTNTYNAKNQLKGVQRKIGDTTYVRYFDYSASGRLMYDQFNGWEVIYYAYDDLGRVSSTNLMNLSADSLISHSYTYLSAPSMYYNSSTTSTRINTETITTADSSNVYRYIYDENGNLANIETNGYLYSTYGYDSLNQLTEAYIEDDVYTYTYDSGGNILSKTLNGVTVNYGYTDANWKDLLTSYNGQTITYDTIGNPLTYRDGMSFTWQGRKLQTATVGTNNLSFAYNADGIRTQKTVNGVTTYYIVDGGKVIAQYTGDSMLYFEYDAAGNVATITSGNTTYYYIRNVFGDILGLADEEGNRLVTYTYDPWGKMLSITDTSGTNIGTINPFRYKGYYYDTETNLYYLNSRYYDPETGRFVNADAYLSTGQGLTGYNMFAYCGNNPVVYTDSMGEYYERTAGGGFGGNAQLFAQAIYDGCVAGAVVIGTATAGALTAAGVEALRAEVISIRSSQAKAKSQEKAKANEKDATVPKSPPATNYWTAEIVNNIVVPFTPLTYSQARLWIEAGGDLLCVNHAAAWGIIKFYPSARWDSAHGCPDSGYLNHYHLSSAHDNHIWYYGV